MTPEQLTEILAQFFLHAGDILSYFLGALTGIAFVLASSMR